MKLRIIFNGRCYRVQYRGWFAWRTFGGGGEYFIPWDYDTQEKAEEEIKSFLNVGGFRQRFTVVKEMEY
jgi:hypothetical protein